jgi:putative membrane protein
MTSRRRRLIRVSGALLALFGYEVVRSWIFDIVRLPGIPGGLTSLTAIMALFSLTHAWYSVGGRLTAAFFALSAVIAWALEEFGVVTGLLYGGYHYTSYLGARLGEVPVLIPLAWFMMIYPSFVIANMAIDGRSIGTARGALRPAQLVRLAAASAAVMTAWDLVIDPILSGPSARAWIWETGGPYFGIPVQNYLGWLLTTFTVYLVYLAVERKWATPLRPGLMPEAAGSSPAIGPLPARSAAAAALPVAAYALMLAADLLSGVAPAGLALIGPVVMGAPVLLAAWRLCRVAGGWTMR